MSVLFAALLLNFIPKNSTQGSSALLVENVVALLIQEQASAGLPVRLKIPVIGVDSAVIPVGLTSGGAMGAPESPDEVAWFNLGPRPGENGSSAMAGHFGWKDNIPAVFDNLHEMKEGDKIYVEDEKGAVVTFVVRETREYDSNADASQVFTLDDGKAHLNLITCQGSWNTSSQSRPKRLVVFADKE